MSSDESIVQEMIEYIENKEKEIQKDRLVNDTATKNTVIKSIINKLEECMTNEN